MGRVGILSRMMFMLAAVVAAALSLAPSAVGDSRLFTPEAKAQGRGVLDRIPGDPGDGTSAPVERSRLARIDYGKLHAAREAVESGRSATLRLNLFRDAEFEAVIERSAPTASGYSLSGRLTGVPHGTAVLVVNGEVTVGTVWTPEAAYSIRTTHGAQTVRRVPHRPWRCGAVAPPAADADSGVRKPEITSPPDRAAVAGLRRQASAGSPPLPDKSGRQLSDDTDDADNGDAIDVLVAYPSFVREIEGGYANLLAMIDWAGSSFLTRSTSFYLDPLGRDA